MRQLSIKEEDYYPLIVPTDEAQLGPYGVDQCQPPLFFNSRK